MNDLPPVNVFPTDDTKAAAFAEKESRQTLCFQILRLSQIKFLRTSLKNLDLMGSSCSPAISVSFPQADLGGFNGSATLLHPTLSGKFETIIFILLLLSQILSECGQWHLR